MCSCGSDVPGHRIHTVQSSTLPLSSAWPETGPPYSWLEHSLSDSCHSRSDVPSSRSGGGEASSALLPHLGNCSTAPGAVILLDGPFLALLPHNSQTAHHPASSCAPHGRRDGVSGWHVVSACGSLSPEPGKADSVWHPSQLRQQPVGARRKRFSSNHWSRRDSFSTAGALMSIQLTITRALLHNTSVFNTNLRRVAPVRWTSPRSLETWLLSTSTASLRQQTRWLSWFNPRQQLSTTQPLAPSFPLPVGRGGELGKKVKLVG